MHLVLAEVLDHKHTLHHASCSETMTQPKSDEIRAVRSLITLSFNFRRRCKAELGIRREKNSPGILNSWPQVDGAVQIALTISSGNQ